MQDFITLFNNEKKFIIIFLTVSLIDFILGVSTALINKDFQSNKLRKGLNKYVAYFAFIAVAIIAEYVFNLQVAHYGTVLPITIEIISVIENVYNLTGNEKIKDFINLIKDGTKK
jgi:toxin secretion/phage lysis holin